MRNWLIFTDEETKEETIQRLKVLQNLSEIQTSTQIFEVGFSLFPVKLSFPSWIVKRQRGKVVTLRESSVSIPIPTLTLTSPPMLSQAESQHLGWVKAELPPTGSWSEGRGTDPRLSICLLLILAWLPPCPTNGPHTLHHALEGSVEHSGNHHSRTQP